MYTETQMFKDKIGGTWYTFVEVAADKIENGVTIPHGGPRALGKGTSRDEAIMRAVNKLKEI